ncbi:MAG: type II toxin-antitoxin system death-on-curing family toxin [Chitinophagaceae bacterium]
MSNRLSPVTIADFLILIEYAKTSHISRHEPIPELKKTDIGNLESCLNTPFQKFQGAYLYKGFIDKACMLFYLLIKNHPLANGNKRMACLCLAYFGFINNYILTIPEIEFYHLAKEIAESNNMERIMKKIKNTLKKNMERI